MGNNIKNYYGIAISILGAVLLILGMLVPFMRDLLDQNIYTIGSLVLIIGGIIFHVIYNKKHLPED
ncbi:MAG: hypothetical protein MJZ20_11710 [Bacteroidaceae bacterium]|nr:hypothetical protein [Bacteroidaceae bacterium]